jgi:hypothetical protein
MNDATGQLKTAVENVVRLFAANKKSGPNNHYSDPMPRRKEF